MVVWDVLGRRTEEGELAVVGGVKAPDPDMALLLARETHFRHKEGVEYAVEQRAGGLRYVCAAGEFAIFISAGVQSGTHTQMGWEVDDIETTVRELRARGVTFEEYDLPGLRTVDGIAEIAGNYPSKGTGERGAWFHDSEGNLLGIGQPVRA